MKRVVQIWNICGIGGLLARYLDRDFPYESVAVDRGHANVYSQNNEKTLVWKNRAMVWLARCFWFSKDFDIIHVHSGIQWLKYFKLVNPRAKIIIHLHGTKIRGRWDEHALELRYADQIIVSTPDLLEGSPDGTQYLPNPVDEALIAEVKSSMIHVPKIRKAFHVDRYAGMEAERFARKYGLELVVFDRDETPLPHDKFLERMASYTHFINVERSKFLGAVAKHQYYVDVKHDYPGTLFENKVLEAFSLTGLEALALGNKVIGWDGTLHHKFPDENRSFNVASKLHEIYQGLEETTIDP